MIEKIKIKNYRKLRSVVFEPNDKVNIVVGDNESGKSTLLEAVLLALTGRINSRSAQEELNPYWFNQEVVKEFFEKRKTENLASPTIEIEIFFKDKPELQRLSGANNSDSPTRSCPGIYFSVAPDPQDAEELNKYFEDQKTDLIPVEYYQIEWRAFSDERQLFSRPKEIKVAAVDSRTLNSTSGIDYQLRQILTQYLDKDDKTAISLAFRQLKSDMTTRHLGDLNEKLKEIGGVIADENVSLGMDQSARGAWDLNVVPHVASIPFGMSGLGQQASIKTEIALARSGDQNAGIVMIEEPENHMSHTKLNKLLESIADIAGHNDQQLFITTHSSFVLNRLGLDYLAIMHNGGIDSITSLPTSTVSYFRKLPGYDTLRIILARKVVLVEGPSDEIVFERLYKDKYKKRPIEDEIDVISMRGLARKNCLAIASKAEKPCALITDNDGRGEEVIAAELNDLLEEGLRELYVGTDGEGDTLEPQLIAANDETTLMTMLGLRQGTNVSTWMKNNKTEAAIRIADSASELNPPSYIDAAIEFIHGA